MSSESLADGLADLFRNLAPEHPVGRIWGRFEGAQDEDGAIGNAWAGSPEDLAEDVVAYLIDGSGRRPAVDGDTSDGYHTFNELYEFRMLYNAHLFNQWARHGRYDVHKSWRHHDGGECFGGGWFIVSAQLPTGQISNHYEAEHWPLFRVEERDRAAEWDGHTAADVADRLRRALGPVEKPCGDCGCTVASHHKLRCEECWECNGWLCPHHGIRLCVCTYAGGAMPDGDLKEMHRGN